jgi:hypothetical protein
MIVKLFPTSTQDGIPLVAVSVAVVPDSVMPENGIEQVGRCVQTVTPST